MPEGRRTFQDENRGATSLLFRDVAAHPARFSRVAPFHVHNHPVLLLAACFAAGVACRSWWQPPSLVVLTCLALLAAACTAWWKAPRVAWIATAAAFVALGWAAVLLQPSREDTSLLRYADGLQRTLEGQVTTSRVVARDEDNHSDTDVAQEEDAGGNAREILTIRALRIEDVTPDASTMAPVRGGVLVTLRGVDEQRLPYLPCGNHVAMTVRLHAPQRYRNPGGWNYADQLDRDGVAAVSLAEMKTVHLLPSTGVPLQCRFLAAQHWSSERMASLATIPWLRHLPRWVRLDQGDVAILRAMLLGDRSELSGSVRTAFERTGSFHLFVVAGVHITILTASLYFLLRRFRVHPAVALCCTLCLGFLYAVFTGFGEPVQRALLMTCVYLVALALSRDRQVFNALGVAVLFMLVVDPRALLDVGLQMTVLSVFAVGGIAVPIVDRTVGPCADALRHSEDVTADARYRPYQAQLRVTARMAGRLLVRPSRRQQHPAMAKLPAWCLRALLLALEATLMTVLAETVMALPMAMYFHRLTPFAAPANVLALPLLGLLLGCAVITFLLVVCHPLLAAPGVVVTAVLLHAVNAVIHAFSGMHGADVRVPAPAVWSVVVALLLWWSSLVLLRTHSARAGWAGVVAAAVAFLLLLVPSAPRIPHDALSFTAIDVGQGDSILVTTPDGKSMVIDAGGPTGQQRPMALSRFDVGEEVVSPFLWHVGLRRIDVLAVTHAHSDHLGGALAVLHNFHPHELWLSVPSPALQKLVTEAAKDGVVVRYLHAGDSMSFGTATVSVLSPAREYRPLAEPTNDDSLVLRMQYGRSSVLAAGDAEAASEAAMAAQPAAAVTLLKVGHHGSNTSTTDEFLQRMRPRYAVISCGRENRFGHPRMQVLQRLAAAQVKTSRTDTMGAVTYLLHTDGAVETKVLMSEP